MTPSSNSLNKNFLFWALQLFFLIAIVYLLFLAVFRNDKVAYVDSAKILNEYKGSTVAKAAFDQKAKAWQSNIDTLTNEVRKAIQQYEKSIATMSPKEQNLSRQLINAKQKQLADYQRSIQENAKQEEGKLNQSVVASINTFLTKYGKEHHYKMIFIANQSGTIAYARDGLDITSAVLEEINSEYTAIK